MYHDDTFSARRSLRLFSLHSIRIILPESLLLLLQELPLPEPPEKRQARQLELRMNQYPAEKLRRMAADPQLTEEERSAAGRILARRDS